MGTPRAVSVPELEMSKVAPFSNVGVRADGEQRAPDSDRSSRQAGSSKRGTPRGPVPVLSQLRALVDTQESHEYCTFISTVWPLHLTKRHALLIFFLVL